MHVLGHERREGLGRKSNSRIGLLLLLLLSIFFVLSSLYAAEASVFRKARETAIETAAPFLGILAGPIAFFQDRVGSVRDYFSVLEQNKALREENAALREWEREARYLRSIVDEYEAIGLYKAPPAIRPVNAFVIGETNDAYAHSMIVNAGRRDDIASGQAVVDADGLVGRTVDVAAHAARVLLLTDIQSRVPVYVDGVFVDGILAGRTSDQPEIVFTLNGDLDRVSAGQKVFTSGAGGTLPRGIYIGEVDRVTLNGAHVRLAANYVRTRLVRIINYAFPKVDENPALEDAPGDGPDGDIPNGDSETDETGTGSPTRPLAVTPRNAPPRAAADAVRPTASVSNNGVSNNGVSTVGASDARETVSALQGAEAPETSETGGAETTAPTDE